MHVSFERWLKQCLVPKAYIYNVDEVLIVSMIHMGYTLLEREI